MQQYVKNIKINEDWLYHRILNKKMLYSVYKYGILSKQLLRENNIPFTRDSKENVGCNGLNYVSVCKRIEDKNGFVHGAYETFIKLNSAFIINPDIEKINSIKVEEEIKCKLLRFILNNKKIIKEKIIVNQSDEYLVKDKIDFENVVGIKLPPYYSLKDKDTLMLINFLIEYDLDLPLIDVEKKIELSFKK